MTTESKSKELTVLDEFRALEVYKYDVIERAAEAIETEVMSEVCDVTDPKGREREKSLAHKVSQAKSRVVKMANGSIQDARATVKAVTSERQRLEERFDGIRDKRKAESIKWEAAEQERIEQHKSRIDAVRGVATELELFGSSEIQGFIDKLVANFNPSVLQEYEAEGELVKKETLDKLEVAFKATKQREFDAAELKRLQDEAEKRKLEDEKKRIAAVAKAEEEERMLEAKRDKEAQEEAEKQRKIDEDARIEQAKADAIKATEDRLAKEQETKDLEAKRKAVNEELARKSAENAELKRQADKDHRAKVLHEVYQAFVECDDRMDIISEIEAGNIPHVQINF